MNRDNREKITELRHELHRHPELSMHETNTAARIKRFLSENTKPEIYDYGGRFYGIK